MADYREISQTYAQGAIRSAILLNSGAIVAVLSQLSQILPIFGEEPIAFALRIFVIGAFLGASTWIFAFLSVRYVDRTLRSQDEGFSKANRFMKLSIFLLIVSFGSFLSGSIYLVGAIG